MLAEDAIRSAIRDYKTKRSKISNTTKQTGFLDVSQNVSTGEAIAAASTQS